MSACRYTFLNLRCLPEPPSMALGLTCVPWGGVSWFSSLASPPFVPPGLPSPTAQGLPPLPSTTPTCVCCAVVPHCLEEELLEPRRRPTTRTSPHSTSEWSDHRQVRYCPACGEPHPSFSSSFGPAHLAPPFSPGPSLTPGGDYPSDQHLHL